MSERKVLFLDFDGVTHSYKDIKKNLFFMPAICERLDALCKEFDLEVVVTSSWRLFHPLEDMKEMLQPIEARRIVGVTVDGGKQNRGWEVQQWLKENKDVSKFVILDDYDEGISELFGENFVKTDPDKGLTGMDATKLKKVFEEK